MTGPRRVRTQAERAGDDHTWRRDLIGVRTADGRMYAPEDVQLVYPADRPAPLRRRWWHSHRREITRIRAESRRLLVRMYYARLTRRNP